MTAIRFGAKDPEEKVPLTYDMANGLDSGEVLTGTPTAAISVASGADPSPSLVLNGAPYLDSTTKKIMVPVQGGVDGADYLIKAKCSTNNPNKLLTLSAVLPVRADP